MLRSVPKNTTIPICYQAPNIQSGWDVLFDIWKIDGTQLEDDTPSDGEVGERGVYAFDFVTPNEDVYVVGEGRRDNGQDPVPFVLKVGQPSPQKLFFYSEEQFTTDPSYRIFDLLGNTLIESTLTNGPGNFWTADTSPVSDNDQYFFEVSTGFVSEVFNLDSIIFQGAGTVFIGGTGVSVPGIIIDGSGVITIDGSANVVKFAFEVPERPFDILIGGTAAACHVPRFFIEEEFATDTVGRQKVLALWLSAQDRLAILAEVERTTGDTGDIDQTVPSIPSPRRIPFADIVSSLEKIQSTTKLPDGDFGVLTIPNIHRGSQLPIRQTAIDQVDFLSSLEKTTGDSGDLIVQKEFRHDSGDALIKAVERLSGIPDKTSDGMSGSLQETTITKFQANDVLLKANAALASLAEVPKTTGEGGLLDDEPLHISNSEDGKENLQLADDSINKIEEINKDREDQCV